MSKSIGSQCLLRQSRVINPMMIGGFFIVKLVVFIRQWVDDNVLNHISDETHARTLWQKLEELYARKEDTNKMFLIKQLMNLRY